MTDKLIWKFMNAGFKRWTKYDMDRLYIDAKALGLYVDRYNTGNISYAKFRGEEISNNYAREMINSKIWIDISTGKLMYKSGSCSTIVQAAEDLMDEIIEQYEQEQAQAIEEGADNENAENDA